MKKTVLEVKNLSKAFGDIQVLNNISFKVDEGDFIAIMGRSGSGKSTLLYHISGMDKPTSGDVIFAGKDIAKLDDNKMSEVRLKHMGFIFQHSYLLKNLSIRDNIILPGFKAGILSREQVNRKAKTLMIKTGIDGVAAHDTKVAIRASKVVYLMDGNIHDELTLGKYEKDAKGKSSRESKLSIWLEKQGF